MNSLHSKAPVAQIEKMTADEWEAKKDAELEREIARAEAEDDAQRREAWAELAATPKQIAYAKSLGVTLGKTASMLEASEAIDAALRRSGSITHRQRMVLRFWGHDAPSAWGRKQVTDWMDAWYAGDRRRKNEWDKFKEESGISAEEENFMLVPWNEGNRRLYPITTPPVVARPQVQLPTPSKTQDATIWLLIGVVLLLGLVVWAGASR